MDNLHRFYTTYSTFQRKRISADPNNQSYRIGPEGEEIYTDDRPEILWQEYVLFDDNDLWWTMGKLHNEPKPTEAHITVDDNIDETSENPVQNKVIAEALKEVENKIPATDTALNPESNNPIANSAVVTAINTLSTSIDNNTTSINKMDEQVQTVPHITEYTLTFSTSQYATLCVPFDFVCPEGIEFQKVLSLVQDDNGEHLKMETVVSSGESCKAHTPYLVKYLGDGSENIMLPKTFHLSGQWSDAINHPSFLHNGILVGTYKLLKIEAGDETSKDICYISKGKYYHKDLGKPLTVNPYKCYIINRPTNEGGGSVEIDSELNTESENAVQNRAVAIAVNANSRRIDNIETELNVSMFRPYDESPAAIRNYDIANEYIDGLIVEGLEYDANKNVYLVIRTDTNYYGKIEFAVSVFNDDSFSLGVYGVCYGYINEDYSFSNNSERMKILVNKRAARLLDFDDSKPVILNAKCFDENSQIKMVSRQVTQNANLKKVTIAADSFFPFSFYEMYGEDDTMRFRVDYNEVIADYFDIKSTLAYYGLSSLVSKQNFVVPTNGNATVPLDVLSLADGSELSNIDELEDLILFRFRKLNVNGRTIEFDFDGYYGRRTLYITRGDDIEEPIYINIGDYLFADCYFNDVVIFTLGNNGGYASESEYIQYVDNAIMALNTDKFIFVTPFGGKFVDILGIDGVKRVENALAMKYGAKYVSSRRLLLNEMKHDPDTTFSTSDQQRASSGLVPMAYIDTSYAPRYTEKISDEALNKMSRRIYNILQKLYFRDETTITETAPSIPDVEPSEPEVTPPSDPVITVSAPTISQTNNTITITCATDGAVIYYTTDGSTPTSESGTQYRGTVNLTTTCIVKAIAYVGNNSSTVSTYSFVFIEPVVPEPEEPEPEQPDTDVSSFVVATWNTGRWSLGNSFFTTMTTDEDANAFAAKVRGVLAKINAPNVVPDILFTQETNEELRRYYTKSTDARVFVDFVNKIHPRDSDSGVYGYARNAIYTLDMDNITEGECVDIGKRPDSNTTCYYTHSVATINGKQVHIVCTHFPPTPNDKPELWETVAKRKQTMANKIIQDMAAYQYVIIAADFNTREFSLMPSEPFEYTEMATTRYLYDCRFPCGFASAGYSCLSGASGTIHLKTDSSTNTYTDVLINGSGDNFQTVDNILVKGLTITNTRRLRVSPTTTNRPTNDVEGNTALSDHDILYCTVSF